MNTLHVEKYHSSVSPWELFQQVYHHSRSSFFLDTPHYAPPNQVYSYIGMNPEAELYVKGETLYLRGQNENRKYPAGKLFSVLRGLLEKHQIPPHRFPFFAGGFVGYWGYDVADLCDKIRFRPRKETGVPRLCLGMYRDIIVYDHRRQGYYLVTNAPSKETAQRRFKKLRTYFQGKTRVSSGVFRLKKMTAGMSEEQFKAVVLKAKAYIAAGDIYQANLSQRFSFDFSGPPLELYGKLRAINPSPFSCFLKMQNLEIISASPERLIRKKGRSCETRPIAGTFPAYGSRRQLRLWRKKLLHNEKENAEHLMLVDLERNDLGRVCDYRSVKVEEFMVLEKYSHVVHLVSKIIGRLKKGKDGLDVIKAMFPGGTITGCPKIRCMEIIDELEPVGRGLYTGSIGYLDFSGDMDWNIVIRTLILKGRRGHLQVGAGIVYDSVPEKEYEETLHKAEALMLALKGCDAERRGPSLRSGGKKG